MFNFDVHYVNLIQEPLKHSGCMPYFGFALVISGVRKWICGSLDLTDWTPFLAVFPNGWHELEFGPGRENWFISIKNCDLRFTDDGKGALLRNSQGEEIRLPLAARIIPEELPGWVAEMRRMRDAMRSPTPLNILRVKVGVANIIRFIIDKNAEVSPKTPVECMKALIDDDLRFTKTLEQISSECGYCSDHMRIIFDQKYGMTPNLYRSQRRVTLAMEMITQSKLTVKEIAYKLGFAHVSAFSTMFQRATGRRPSEAIDVFRYGKE